MISEEKISDVSTLCSNNTKEMEDTKAFNAITIFPINSMGVDKLFHSSSAKNLSRKSSLCFLKLEPENHKKYFKSKIKIINNTKQQYYINNTNNYNLNKYKKINIVNKKIPNNKSKCKININNAPIPIHNKRINNKNIKHNIIKKIEKLDLFSQNKNISCMIERPPKIPSLYEHDYNLQSKKLGEVYGELNKETVPIIFYNHLMVDKNNKKFTDNKKTYFKSSITHRNKKKMLTIIYYSPKLQ